MRSVHHDHFHLVKEALRAPHRGVAIVPLRPVGHVVPFCMSRCRPEVSLMLVVNGGETRTVGLYGVHVAYHFEPHKMP